MKNVKMILPIVAFVFAVVGAFASINAEIVPPYYIEINGQCNEVTVACQGTEFLCSARKPDGKVYQVYDIWLNETECQNVVQHSSPEPIQIP